MADTLAPAEYPHEARWEANPGSRRLSPAKVMPNPWAKRVRCPPNPPNLGP